MLRTIKNHRLSDLIPILEKYGYDCSGFYNLYPYDDEMCFDEYPMAFHKTIENRYVMLEVEFIDSYVEKFADALHEYEDSGATLFDKDHPVPGFEKLDLSKCMVMEAFISGPVGTGTCTMNEYDDSSGISLTWRWMHECYKDRHIQDANIQNIERAVWIENNHLEYAKFILDSFIKNLEVFERCCKPILAKYDFYEKGDSLFSKYDGEDSTLFIEYCHPTYENSLYLETDIFTGEVRISGAVDYGISFEYKKKREEFTREEFEDLFIKRIVNSSDEHKEMFAYVDSKDPNENIKSYKEVWNCRYILNKERYVLCERPNLNNIPERYKDIGQKALYMYDFNHRDRDKKGHELKWHHSNFKEGEIITK